MTIYWQTILEQQSHLTQVDCPTDSPSFTALSQFGVIQVRGSEAQTFLQNLLTNDINQLEIGQCQFNGLCNPKGRLLALFHVIRREADYLLILPKTMCNSLIARLSMYVLRSDVTISNESETYYSLGLMNSNKNDIAFIKPAIPYSKNYFILILSLAEMNEQVAALSAQNWQLCSENVWEKQDINKGFPMIYPQSREQFTPQQVNLDLVGGVSFQKGCYPGQEVVARLHYLGNPSRRMFTAEANLSISPEIGSEIKNKTGEVAGHIVRYVQLDDQNFVLLVSLKLSELDTDLFINQVPLSITNTHIETNN